MNNTNLTVDHVNPCCGRVLVVDDEHKNRDLLSDLLQSRGCEVIEAKDGEIALEKARNESPDVILLDVMMPKLNGNEVCRQLKADDETKHIPIIMVTSLTDRSNRLKGIEAGADDFMSKPIDVTEVWLRVSNAITSKHLYDQVKASYSKLKGLETLRDQLVHMIVHDMKNHLFGISGYLDMMEAVMEESGSDNTLLSYVKNASFASDSLLALIQSLLDINRMEDDKMPVDKKNINMIDLVHHTFKMLKNYSKDNTLAFNPTEDPIMINADQDLISRVVMNLLTNALKFTPKGKEVRLEVERNPDHIKLKVIDQGPGIPEEYHDMVFEKFGVLKQREKGKMFSTGLGLTFCKMAAEIHGGQIGIKSIEGEGSTFWFTLPILPNL